MMEIKDPVKLLQRVISLATDAGMQAQKVGYGRTVGLFTIKKDVGKNYSKEAEKSRSVLNNNREYNAELGKNNSDLTMSNK